MAQRDDMVGAKEKKAEGAIYREVAEIRDELSRQGGLLRTLVHAQSKELTALIVKALEDDDVLARSFALLSTPRTQREVVEELASENIAGASQPSVSRRMTTLEKELGLISRVASDGEKKYVHSDAVEALKILPLLKKNPALKALF